MAGTTPLSYNYRLVKSESQIFGSPLYTRQSINGSRIH